MIYAIVQELAAALKVQGVPFPVVFGPEPFASTTATRERIVVEQLIDGKRDEILATRGVHPNPRQPLLRLQAIRVRIFARSGLSGAAWHDHTERAEQVVDHVVGELDAIVRGRKNQIAWGGAGFVTLVDEKGASAWSGAVYELDLAIDRGVMRRTWKGEARDEVVIGVDVTLKTTLAAS